MKPGRKRSEASRLAILEATREQILLLGYERITIDAIASAAGVGKQTVYRWWGSKAALVAETVLEHTSERDPEPIPDSGSLMRDIRFWARDQFERGTTPEAVSLTLALTAAAAGDQQVADLLFARFTEPNERRLVDRLRAGQRVGQLPERVNVEVLAGTLVGYLLYRVLVRQPHATMAEVDDLLELLIPEAPGD